MFPAARVHRIMEEPISCRTATRDMPVWGDAFGTTREVDHRKPQTPASQAIVRYRESIQQRRRIDLRS